MQALPEPVGRLAALDRAIGRARDRLRRLDALAAEATAYLALPGANAALGRAALLRAGERRPAALAVLRSLRAEARDALGLAP